MLRPVFDEDVGNRRWPWLCLALALLWVGCFAVSPEPARWGLLPDATGLSGLLGFALLHVSGAHLFVSLALLALVGPPLEDRWGTPFFAGFVLTSAWLGGGVYALATADSVRPLVGPSALLAGLTAAALTRFLRTGLRFRYTLWFRDWIHGTFWTPVLAVAPVWFVGEVWLEAVSSLVGPTRGINYSAQLFCGVLGVGVAALLLKTGAEERLLRRGIAKARSSAAEQVIRDATLAREDGRSGDAYELLAPALIEHPRHAGVAVAFWKVAIECGREPAALPLLTRFIERNAESAPDAAADTWRAILTAQSDAELDLRLRLILAPLLHAAGHPREAALTLHGGLTSRGRPLSPGMALRLAEAARSIHPPTAIAAARRALQTDGLDSGKRKRIEALIDAIEEDPANLEAPDLEAAGDSPVAGPIENEPSAIALEEAGDDLSLSESDPGSAPETAEAPEDFDDPRALDLGAGPDRQAEPLELSADGSLVTSEGDSALAEHDPSELTVQAAPLAPATSAPGPITTAITTAGSEPVETGAAARELPPPPEPEAWSDEIALDVAGDEPRFTDVKVIEAAPAGLTHESVMLESDGRRPSPLALSRIEAIAIAVVEGLAPKPVLLVDLLLNWTDCSGGPLKIARLRSDRFDPRPLAPDAKTPVDAVRSLTAALLEHSGAVALPSADPARGGPLPRFASIDAYQSEVLGVAS